MNDSGWRPLGRPEPKPEGAEGFVVTPFVRLARVHAAAAASDGAITAALAGSIFFSISPDESRGRVALALLLTMTPFAVVTPLIGPVIDRVAGGRRMMILGTLAARAVLAFLMIRHFDTLLLFPEAFGILVLQKGYAVSKSAVVPQFVKNEQDFVSANSRLALLSSIAGPVGAGIAGALSVVGGPAIAAAIAMLGFIFASVLALQLPKVVVAPEPVEPAERAELRDAKILLAATSMAAIRGAVGFITMLLMFELRGGKEALNTSGDGAALGGATATVRGIDITGDPRAPVWHFGLVGAFAVVGSLTGARSAPALRHRATEERMLAGSLAAIVGVALFSAVSGSIFATALLAFIVSMGTVTGKLSFDALVQRDAPDANYGRSFARFEARFQLAFAAGAFVPVMVRMGVQVGSWLVATVLGVALFSYIAGGPGRGAFTRRLRTEIANVAGSRGRSSDDDDDPTVELPDDDLRPSQPSPPAAAAEIDVPEFWDDTTPYVSSIDGVEVDPTPPADDRARDDGARDDERD
ncbi:MAG: MFS transporter [Acidimicrobiales bacterium]